MEQYPLCRHIKTNGLQCHAPALAGGQWCYFHNRLHTRHSRFRPNDANREYFTRGRDLELCALEDRESVQLAISVVINALATNNIETKRATALLYGLQLASSNAVRLNNAPETPEVVRTVESSPDGLDLAQPGAIIEVYTRLEPLKSSEEDRQPAPVHTLPRGRHSEQLNPERLNRSRHSDPDAANKCRHPERSEGSPHFADSGNAANGAIETSGDTDPEGPTGEPTPSAPSSAAQPSNAAPSTAVP